MKVSRINCCVSDLSLARYMPCPSHLLSIRELNDVCWRVKVTKLFMTQFFPSSFYILFLGSRYAPERPVLKYSLSCWKLLWLSSGFWRCVGSSVDGNASEEHCFNPEDGDSMFLRNFFIYRWAYTEPESRKTQFSPSWKPQISYNKGVKFHIFLKYTKLLME